MPEKLMPPDTDAVTTLVFFLVIFGVVGAFFLFIHLVMGSVVRPNKPDAEKLTIYECGEPTVGSAWIQFDLRFYVVALLFVIFDVEVAFFFPWATVFGKANQIADFDEPMIQLVEQKKALNPKKLLIEDLPAETRKQMDDLDKQMAELQIKPKKIMEELMPAGLTTKEKGRLGLLTQVKREEKDKAVPGAPDKKEDLNKKEEAKEKSDPGPQVKTEGLTETAAVEPGVARRWAQVAFFDILVFFAVLMVGFAYVWRRGDIDWVRAYKHHQEPPVEPEKPLEQKAGV